MIPEILGLLLLVGLVILAFAILRSSKKSGGDETWKTYDWTQHESEHYDPLLGERSYGLIVFNKDNVLMVQNFEGNWGFPKGHREDGETPYAAAKREVVEETDIQIPDDIEPLGTVSMNYDRNYTEEKLNKHIATQLNKTPKEKPHWNMPGVHPGTIMFYVVKLSGDAQEPKLNDVGIKAVKWVEIASAEDLIKSSNSNQTPLLLDAVKLLK